jgi:hypothetical protein
LSAVFEIHRLTQSRRGAKQEEVTNALERCHFWHPKSLFASVSPAKKGATEKM